MPDSVIADLDRKVSILLDEVLSGGFGQAVIDQKRGELIAQRTSLEAEAKQIRQELEVITITPDQEAELVGFAQQMKDTLNDLTFEHKRRILELIRLRVDVISRTKVKLTGVISSEGLIVDLAYWRCLWYDCLALTETMPRAGRIDIAKFR